MGRYDYAELRKTAESGNSADINALGKWFEEYGQEYWNGEYFDADGMKLFPIYEKESLIGWTLDAIESLAWNNRCAEAALKGETEDGTA